MDRILLTQAPLDPAAIERLVSSKERGAVVTFSGVVRDRENGSAISAIVYEAYDSFFVTDFKISYDATRRYRMSFYANNIFDEEYFQYYKAPGRTLGVELVVKF